VRTGPYHEGHGAEPARRAEAKAQAPTEGPDRAEGTGAAQAPSESSGRAKGANAEASTMMHVEFVKVLTVLLVIALVVAAWPEPPEDD
jgi:hypothetical protein